MSESIVLRARRLVSAGLENVVGTAERLSGISLMRETVRKMERAVASAQDQLAIVQRRSADVRNQIAHLDGRIDELGDHARYALGKGREDLASAALAQQMDLESCQQQLRHLLHDGESETIRLNDSIATLTSRKTAMQGELAAFQAMAQRSMAMPAPSTTTAAADRRAERAEETFGRALKAGIEQRGTAASLRADEIAAEIDALRREALVEQRLAALRSVTATAPSGPDKAPGAKPSGKSRRTPKAG